MASICPSCRLLRSITSGSALAAMSVVFVINPLQGFLIQIQFDHPAFIVNRAGGSVLNRLSHVIDVNVVPEHFAGACCLWWRREFP